MTTKATRSTQPGRMLLFAARTLVLLCLSGTCLAANPPLDIDTLSSVMGKVMAKQEKKPVACVCQDGSGQAGLVSTTNPAPGIYTQSCLFFVLSPGGLPPIPVTCAQFTYVPK